jgi:uncharacterized protein
MVADRVHLLVLQPTSFCNLDCIYCYVPDRGNGARMSMETLRKVCTALIESGRLRNQTSLEVLWHAGEPLAAGLPFYRKADAVLHATLGVSLAVSQTFQTNATLVTTAWCEYFRESGANVGVSLDGPEDIHDAQRMNRKRRGSFDQVMRGIALLREHGIELNVLCVLTKTSLTAPERVFDFFCSLGVSNLGFNVEEVEGENRVSSLSSSGDYDDVRRRYGAFMKRFLDLNLARGSPMKVRELEIQARHLWNRRRDLSYFPEEPEHYSGRIMTVTREGEVHSWSPELASGLPQDPLRFSLGNIHDVVSIDELLNGDRAQRIQADIFGGIDKCRRTCRYFGVCGGGSPANKVYENGSFNSTETMKCRLQIQALTEMLLEHASATGPDEVSEATRPSATPRQPAEVTSG